MKYLRIALLLLLCQRLYAQPATLVWNKGVLAADGTVITNTDNRELLDHTFGEKSRVRFIVSVLTPLLDDKVHNDKFRAFSYRSTGTTYTKLLRDSGYSVFIRFQYEPGDREWRKDSALVHKGTFSIAGHTFNRASTRDELLKDTTFTVVREGNVQNRAARFSYIVCHVQNVIVIAMFHTKDQTLKALHLMQ